ncbi:MAG: hypothetical protein L3I91_00530 [Mycoplasma sp.]
MTLDHQEELKIEDSNDQSETNKVNHIDQIASLYELGSTSDAKIGPNHAFNYAVLVLSLISFICLGIICGYLIHIFL